MGSSYEIGFSFAGIFPPKPFVFNSSEELKLNCSSSVGSENFKTPRSGKNWSTSFKV
jgi:hypothetical protein